MESKRFQRVAAHETEDDAFHAARPATRKSRAEAVKSSFFLLIPVGITLGILSLSFRNVYFANANSANLTSKLAGFQVAAKLHEILVLMSMAAIVLHYMRKLLASPSGVPFGLLEAAYQSALSGHPWSKGYWYTLKQMFRRTGQKSPSAQPRTLRPWHVALLLSLFAILALFVGPASAVALIPKLGWWHRMDMIGPLQLHSGYTAPSFSAYIPRDLFPSEVNGSTIPGRFCESVDDDVTNACPFAGFPEVFGSLRAPSKVDNGGTAFQNYTVSSGKNDLITRRMLYLQDSSNAVVTIPSFVMASFATLLKLPTSTSRPTHGSDPGLPGEQYQSDGVFTVDLLANGIAPFSPLVGVHCNDSATNYYDRVYTYADNSGINTGSFDIRKIWDDNDIAKPFNGSELTWQDVTPQTGTPVMLALWRHSENLTVCSIQSSWSATTEWILSSSSYDVASDNAIPIGFSAGMYGYRTGDDGANIHINQDWGKALNALNGSMAALDEMLQSGVEAVRAMSLDVEWDLVTNVDPDTWALEATVSQLLAKSIADGLSRIGAEYAATNFVQQISQNNITVCHAEWCSEGPWFASQTMPLAIVANTSREHVVQYFSWPDIEGQYDDWTNNPNPVMRSFRRPANADNDWTRIQFPVRQYGYAYSFDGLAIRLAAALLIFCALVTLIHVVVRVGFDYATLDFGESLGSLLLMAIGDHTVVSRRSWSKKVGLRPLHYEDSEGHEYDLNRYKLVLL